eukprot:5179720-Alexandrium_andersonii.AAC.1
MSASLVGSEMCIRDRALPVAPQGVERHVDGACLDMAPKEAQRILRDPVSYTHLTLPTICSV